MTKIMAEIVAVYFAKPSSERFYKKLNVLEFKLGHYPWVLFRRVSEVPKMAFNSIKRPF